MHLLGRAAIGLGAFGAGTLAYAAGYEARRGFRLREVTIPCLPPDADSLRVLHLSDLHLTPSQRPKADWLRSLGELEPDLVVDTGDNIAHPDSIALLGDILERVLQVPGVYVHGSNDYYRPVFKNPLRYFLPNGGEKRIHGAELPTDELDRLLQSRGWLELDNARGTLTVRGVRIAFAGVDDPHLKLDDLEAVSGEADPSADVRIAVAHAPYLRVLDRFATDGYDVIFAGHTHGGQLRIPAVGALVTNCDLDRARCRGLSTHTVDVPEHPGVGRHSGTVPAHARTSWLHVSAGCGTSPFAPYRVACHPEATLATLIPRFPA